MNIIKKTLELNDTKYDVEIHQRSEGENFNRIVIGAIHTIIEKVNGKWVAKGSTEELSQIIGKEIEKLNFEKL